MMSTQASYGTCIKSTIWSQTRCFSTINTVPEGNACVYNASDLSLKKQTNHSCSSWFLPCILLLWCAKIGQQRHWCCAVLQSCRNRMSMEQIRGNKKHGKTRNIPLTFSNTGCCHIALSPLDFIRSSEKAAYQSNICIKICSGSHSYQ